MRSCRILFVTASLTALGKAIGTCVPVVSAIRSLGSEAEEGADGVEFAPGLGPS